MLILIIKKVEVSKQRKITSYVNFGLVGDRVYF